MANIIEIIKYLAWPVVVIIIYLSLKKPLKLLLDRISSMEFQGLKLGASQTPKSDENLIGNTAGNNKEGLPATTAISPQVIPVITEEIKDSDPKGLKLVKEKMKFWAPQTMEQISNWLTIEVSLNDEMDAQVKIQLLKKYSTIMFFQFWCERAYDLIFGSQIALLNSLNSIQSDKEENLKRFYDEGAKYGRSDAFINIAFNKYLGFLYDNQFISKDFDNNVSLTFLGKDFLRYILDAGKTQQKPF